MSFNDRGFYTLHDIDRMYDDVLNAQRIVQGTFKNDKTGIGDMFRFKSSGANNGTQLANQSLYQMVPMQNIAIDSMHMSVPTDTIVNAGTIQATFQSNRFTSVPVVNVTFQSTTHNYIAVITNVTNTKANITFKPSSGSLVVSGSITPSHLLHVLAFGKGG
jgi:hypothetical protein